MRHGQPIGSASFGARAAISSRKKALGFVAVPIAFGEWRQRWNIANVLVAKAARRTDLKRRGRMRGTSEFESIIWRAQKTSLDERSPNFPRQCFCHGATEGRVKQRKGPDRPARKRNAMRFQSCRKMTLSP
jgi:hypothetical protein